MRRGRLLAPPPQVVEHQQCDAGADADEVDDVAAGEALRRQRDRQRDEAVEQARHERQRRQRIADDARRADEQREQDTGEIPHDQIARAVHQQARRQHKQERQHERAPTDHAGDPAGGPAVGLGDIGGGVSGNATGGVIIDSIPLYMTNMCAAIGVTPSLISAGASSVAVMPVIVHQALLYKLVDEFSTVLTDMLKRGSISIIRIPCTTI